MFHSGHPQGVRSKVIIKNPIQSSVNLKNMKALKFIFFLISFPIVFGLATFFDFAYGSKERRGWFQNIWEEKGNYVEKSIGVLLAPLLLIVAGFLYLTYDAWEKLPE